MRHIRLNNSTCVSFLLEDKRGRLGSKFLEPSPRLPYDHTFGVEGAVPAVIADAVLGAVCLILAAKHGRLNELGQRRSITL